MIRSILLSAILLTTSISLAGCEPADILRWAVGSPSANRSDSPRASRAPNSYYRMKADLIVKESGEPISFDYVVGCGGTVQNYLHTTPSVVYDYAPQIMFQPLENGSALGIVTVAMCQEWKWEVEWGKSRIPDNLRPLAIWFDDANDLSFGWGYKTDDAYESPLAKIEFVNASVEQTDEAAWRAWREDAENEYVQIGALPGPWGYSELSDYLSYLDSLGADEGYFGIVGARCPAAGWVPVEQEFIDAIFELAPSDVGQYWLVSDARNYAAEELEELFGSRTAFGSGEPLSSYTGRDNPYLGTLSREGGGHVTPLINSSGSQDGYGYREVYPLLPRSKTMPEAAEVRDTYTQKIIKQADYKGFGACHSGGRPIDALTEVWPPLRGYAERLDLQAFDAEGLQKDHELLVNGAKVTGTLSGPAKVFQQQDTMLDREGFIVIRDD